MNISAPFIKRPVATTLLTIALLLSGMVAYNFLPVAPLPEVDFPTVMVNAGLPGASPETMGSAVATPLERQFGRIAGVTEMTSNSGLGRSNITLQFDLSRNIDAAARDVQAAINASLSQLPQGLPTRPNFHKINPADAPIVNMVLSSTVLPLSSLYDVADSIVGQKLSQVEGVGQVQLFGGARPAVRIELNPLTLAHYDVGLENVRIALQQINANQAKGSFDNGMYRWSISDNDQLFHADNYRNLIVAYRRGSPIRLSDLGQVTDGVENIYNSGLVNGEPCISMQVFRQPGANIVKTVDNIRAALPELQASIPAPIRLSLAQDRTATIRASVFDIQITLLITVTLVILVIFVFLRSVWSTLIPAIAVPVSLIGTFGVMYLVGYSIDNLSLMAMTIVTGFVVDDAIVVIENITRHLEEGVPPLEAALKGSKEISFTVLSMSLSLTAVFIPILLMSGIVGRLFREFAVVMCVAVFFSLLISLTTTPMMCARFLRAPQKEGHNWAYRLSEAGFNKMLAGYDRGVRWVLKHQAFTLMVLLATVCVSVYLYVIIPKGFFPQQDTGTLSGGIQASQDISFDAMRIKQRQFMNIVMADPAVDTIISSVGGGSTNTGQMNITLKPISERKVSADQVINRLRRQLSAVPGATLFLQANQDIRVGGRMSSSQFQYSLQSESISDLNTWAPRMLEKMRTIPQLRDVATDQQVQGLEARLVIDRDTAYRLGIPAQALDNTLYDAFGQRQVSTMYTQLNQYHVVMEVSPEYQTNPDALKNIYVQSSTGMAVPISAFTHFEPHRTSIAVSHQGQFPAITLSFNLAPGVALGDAVTAIQAAASEVGLPATINANFAGTAQAFQASLSNQLVLILAALAAVYIVLGMLYESYIHPITILSTLPSAGVGALLALLIVKMDLTVIAMIGVILLIGIVKKNAILMIDFALDAQRKGSMSAEEAIYKSCLLRFRPIMMTTMAALLGALPLAVGTGTGSELRRPLGISIVGGLIVSQMLTLFTTPVVYLYMERVRVFLTRRKVAHAPLRPSPQSSD